MPLQTRLASILLVVATALPVLFLTTPPIIDVLGHIGRYQLQTGLDAHPWLQTYYAYHWQVIGNLGADLLVETLQPLLGVMGAARLAVVLVPLLTASAILRLSYLVHGRITAFAVASLALVYALPFSWGFLNFTLSMGLALHAFALWLNLGLSLGPSKTRPLLFVPIGLAIWLCHTFGWAFLGILCTAESLVRHHQNRHPILLATLRDVAPLLAPLVPMLAWRSGATGVGISGWFDLPQKAQWLLAIQRLDWETADKASAGFLLVLVAGGLASRRVAIDRRIGLAATFAFAAFLLLPKQIFGSVFADMRLIPYAVVLALLAMRPRDAKPGAALMVVALTFLAFRLGLTGHVYREREAAVERQLDALSAIPTHARVAMLVEAPCQAEWALPWYSHLGSLALTRKPIFVNDQWANAGMNPLRVHFPAAGAYATDDRQLFFPPRCRMAPTLTQTLGTLPLRAFTHVWVVGTRPEAIPERAELTLSWRSNNAAVLAVER